jgi:hypothetical protein
MALSYKNRQLILDKYPEVGQAFDDLMDQLGNVSTQANANPNGITDPPIAPSALKVTAAHGIFDAQIIDRNPVQRGINYFLEYSDNPQFNAPHTIDLGQSRNHRANLGNAVLYWRAHSSYPTSSRSAPVFHGSQASPIAVVGGGTATGPVFLPSEGSGTSNGPSGSDGAFGNNPRRQ